jgi:hypothetical protein
MNMNKLTTLAVLLCTSLVSRSAFAAVGAVRVGCAHGTCDNVTLGDICFRFGGSPTALPLAVSCTQAFTFGMGELCSQASDYCFLDFVGLTPTRSLGAYCADSPAEVDAIVTCIDGGLPGSGASAPVENSPTTPDKPDIANP